MKNFYLVLTLLLCSFAVQAQSTFTLRIMHNNDGESKIVPETVDGMKVGGAAEFKAVVDSLRATGMPNVMLSSGDNFLAGVAFNASLNRAAGQPYYDAVVIDSIGYDAIALGNHDFDFGPEVLAKMISDINVTMPTYLGANLDFSAEPALQALVDAGRIAPRTTITVDGEQVGVISLIYEELATISSPRGVVALDNLQQIAQQQIDALEGEGVNKIIMISHLQSINNELELLQNLTGVDVWIAGGGDELLTNDPSIALPGAEVFGEYPLVRQGADGKDVYIVTTPGEYRYVGNLMVSFDDNGEVMVVNPDSDLVPVFDIVPDAVLQTTVTDSITAYSAEIDNNIIATAEPALDGTRGGVRTRETNQGNLIADAFTFLAERDRDAYGLAAGVPIIGLQNGGGIRNDEIIPAGSTISEGKTFDMLPFSNTLVVLDHQFTATEIKEILENGVSNVEDVDGRFLQVSGIEFVWDPTQPAGSRIISAELSDGTTIVDNYEVAAGAPSVYIATNSFTAGGGDGYGIFADKTPIVLPFSYQRALFTYLVEGLNGQITAAQYPEGGEGRIQRGGMPSALDLRIMHNNDGESKIVPETVDGMKVGGAAEFKAVVDSLRATGMPNVMLSSGDNFLAGVAFNASLNRAAGQPYYDAVVIDSIGYDAIALGNHDFDFGPEVLAKMISDINVTMPTYLGANLDFSAEPALQALVDAGRIAPRTTITVDGEQVGVISLIYEELATISSPRGVVALDNLQQIAQQQIDALEGEGVNKIIMISHLQSINNELELLQNLTGVDVWIAGGGDELLTNDPSIALPGAEVFGEYPLVRQGADGKDVYIVTTPGEYRYVGNLMVSFDDNGEVMVVNPDSDLVPVFDIVPDAVLQTTVTDSITAYSAEIDNNIIATAEPALDGTRGGVRTRETNQGNLIADAFTFLAERDRDAYGLAAGVPIIGLQNGGGIRNDEIIPAGSTISEGKTFDMLPFSNTLVVLDHQFTATEIKEILENGVSNVEDVDGRFLQVSGIEFVWDPTQPAGSRIISAELSDGTTIVDNYEVAAGAPSVYIATNSFTAGGGDGYGIFADKTPIVLPFSYQRALFTYLVEGLNGQITAAQYPEGGEGRIQRGVGRVGDSDKMLDLFLVSSYETGVFDESAAEILAYDATLQRIFFTNADANTVTILDASDIFNLTKVADIDMSVYGDGVNSVDHYNGTLAVAMEAAAVDANGKVVFFDVDGNYINDVEVGVLPDMVTFTNGGNKVLTANEGEPDDNYMIDPEGSVSIIDVSGGYLNATVTNITFEGLNNQIDALREAGVRIFGPGATVAQDLEPEYIAVTEDDAFAFVALQENNALAKIDLTADTLVAIVPLGYKDHSLVNNGIDASNRTDDIDIRPWPTLGMYQPDAMKSVNIGGVDYIVTANEGDARDYDAFSEETRVEDLTLDTTAYPNFAELQMEENLGRLRTTNATGDTDGDGDFDQIYSYGARSFSIWDADGNLVFDSRNKMESVLAELFPMDFNSNNDENDSFKSRSDDKGPEPEAVEIVKVGSDVFALIGLERIGGIMVFDITDPANAEYVSYVNNRDFTVMDATSSEVGDLGVEDIIYIPAADSPEDGVALVLTANEVSGTVSVFSVDQMVTSTENTLDLAEVSFRAAPNPFHDAMWLTYELDQSSRVDITLVDLAGRPLRNLASGQQPQGRHSLLVNTEDLPQGMYIVLVQVDGKVAPTKVIKQ